MIKLTPTDPRMQLLLNWLQKDLNLAVQSINPASSDASFRRYFRVQIQNMSYIVMDAPPPQEDIRPFIKIARLFAQTGLHIPEIYESETQQGFLLLGDLGNQTYLNVLNRETADSLYKDALDSLLTLQKSIDPDASGLPIYNEALLLRELELFREWFLQKLLGISLNSNQNQMLNDMWCSLTQSALEQPRVCVHRDYHSRNLMFTNTHNPGILDFQDAVIGPVSYDLISLLRDCYISWPDQKIREWIAHYQKQLEQNQLIAQIAPDIFNRWVDWMGIQRHLKAIGIFSRLKIRDGKSTYLADIPRTFAYIQSIARQYPQLDEFTHFLDSLVIPGLHIKQSTSGGQS